MEEYKHLNGKTGLELESQRITPDGHLAMTDHPFPGNTAIDRDFGEAQTEINTPPEDSAEAALAYLHEQLVILQKRLKENGELLWTFSNPPAIRDESEIRIAVYEGRQAEKTVYRQYLAAKYGKYKMTFSGIHYNYSFSDKGLKNTWTQDRENKTWQEWKDGFYLGLASKVLEYSWMIVALLSASPLIDGSYYEKNREGETVDTGVTSLRCSGQGYWNLFSPVLSYRDMPAYTASIDEYVQKGFLQHEGELYYPVRIKPKGKYSLKNLVENGADHIELRLIDLNPFAVNGIDLRDLQFLELFLVWLAGQTGSVPDGAEQLRHLQNCKNGAEADWKKPCLLDAQGNLLSIEEKTESVITRMQEAFKEDARSMAVLAYQSDKIRIPENRYAGRVKQICREGYLKEGIKRAVMRQEELHV